MHNEASMILTHRTRPAHTRDLVTAFQYPRDLMYTETGATYSGLDVLITRGLITVMRTQCT